MPRISVNVKGASRTVNYWLTNSLIAPILMQAKIVSGVRFKGDEWLLASKDTNISTLKAVARKLEGK